MPTKPKNSQPKLFQDNGKDKHNTKASLSSLIKSSRDIMRKDAGLNGDLDRLPQLSWILFLKCYDDLEMRREEDAKLERKAYKPVIPSPYRWRDWASDEDTGSTGEDLIKFVNDGLLPALRGLTGSDERLKVAEVFKETYNRMLSGYLLRDVVNLVDNIHFQSKDEIFTLAHLYESMLKEMRDAAGDSGEFYTPRPVVKLIVDRVKPRLGESVLDPACGTGGFLVESYEYLKPRVKNSKEQEALQTRTLYGVEKKPLPYLLSTMNLLLHGIETPNIRRDNALKNPLNEIGEKDRFDVIVTNPPFGGEEEAGIQLNFPENTRASETALLFMQFIMRSLRHGGRCGIIFSDGVLSSPGVFSTVRKMLVENFNLHTIVRLPRGVFTPYTPIATNILFFDHVGKTDKIWYYEIPLPAGRTIYTKTKPIKFEEFNDCIQWWDKRTENENAWVVDVSSIVETGYDLDIPNPSKRKEINHVDIKDLVINVARRQESIAKEIEFLKTQVLEWDNLLPKDVEKVPLSLFLQQRKEFIQIDDNETYSLATVQLHARGIKFRKTLLGSEIKTKKQQVLKGGELVVAEIDAKMGGFGIVPEELAGAIFSSHYFVYEIDTTIIEPDYLKHFLMSGIPEREIQKFVKGSTNYASIRAKHFPMLEIAFVKDKNEQRRIVAYLDGLQAKVNVLRGLQSQSQEELDALLPSVLDRAFKGEL